MTTESINVPLTPAQIQFMMDMMMGCPLGVTSQFSAQHNVSDAELYNYLQSFLK